MKVKAIKSTGMVPMKFIRNQLPYVSGDIVGVLPERVTKFIEDGIAEPVKIDGRKTPCVEVEIRAPVVPGDEPVDASAAETETPETEASGSGEGDDLLGPGNQEDAAGTGEAKTGEQPSSDDEETSGDAGDDEDTEDDGEAGDGDSDLLSQG